MMPAAGPPHSDVPEPAAIARVAGDRPRRCVWRNELGGLTFDVAETAGAERLFVKWSPRDVAPDLAAEADRLRWAINYTPVPHVLDLGSDDEGSWLVTAARPGVSAVDARWLADPETAVRALGSGLRELHDALPVRSCPFSWTAPERLAEVRRRAASGRIDPTTWSSDHQVLDVPAAVRLLSDIPAADREVVCHGDPCAPNTLIGEDGRWTAHVDLGTLGVADRWADLAVATWSLNWNYGPGWEPAFFDAYGCDPDATRMAYYRLLWDLGP
ncbi:aminoglycoside 3'-phosphotransferase [Nocardia jiangxiensis]|uniref:Aminoglycoside 3'-phosphotransferase n=1 Tax=Nocardia jiangxiensis TaxID=282685 RepID=A0ABW6RYL1_9NOCA